MMTVCPISGLHQIPTGDNQCVCVSHCYITILLPPLAPDWSTVHRGAVGSSQSDCTLLSVQEVV